MSAWLISPPSSGTLLSHFALCPLYPPQTFPYLHGLLGFPTSGSLPIPWGLLRHPSSLPSPPTLLRRSSDAPPTLLRRSFDAPPTLLRRSSTSFDAPPTPWLPHFASCLPHLQQTPFHLAQAHPLLHRPTPPSRGPISSNCPPRPDLYYVHLQGQIINDSVNN